MRFFFCILLFALCVTADNNNATCTDAIDATADTSAWVKGDSSYYQAAACAFKAANFDQQTTANPPMIVLTADNSTCEKAYVPNVSFGIYTCNMMVPGVAGTVTSCMVESSVSAPYENVYFKFFGNDTTRVYLGFFSNGIVNQAGPILVNQISSGFNPKNAFHTYTIEYFQNYIKWSVDGIEVSSEYGYRPIPQTPNRFTIGLVTESPNIQGEDSKYPTDGVNRVFTSTSVVSAYFANLTYVPFTGTGCAGTNTTNPNVPTADAATCDPRAPLPVYTDSPQNGFTIESTDPYYVANLAATTTYAGVSSISFSPVRGDLQFFLNTSTFYTNQYYGVEFWLNSGSQNLQVSMYAMLSGGGATQAVPLSVVLTSGFALGAWTHVMVPFSTFGFSPVQPTALIGFGFTFPDKTNYGSTLYIDGVYLSQRLPICNNQTQFIYDSGLDPSIKDNSYGLTGSVITNYKGDSYNGTECIRWDVLPSNGISFHFQNGPLNTNLWKAISMRIKFGNMSSNTWSMYFTSPDSTAQYNRAGAMPLNLFNYFGGVVPQGVWPKADWPLIVIPFYDFGIGDNINLDGIVIASDASYSQGYQGTLFFDDIAFISNIPKDQLSDTSSASFLHFPTIAVLVSALVYLFL